MSLFLSPSDRAAVEATLRASGCVFAEDEAAVLLAAARDEAALAAMVDRRTAGTPLEYVVGWAEFCGLRIAVTAGVFVPRRRTEFLVAEAVALTPPRGVVVDMCCGTGAVGAAIAAAVPETEVHAVDMDPAAVECARANLPTGAVVYQGDLYEPLPRSLLRRVDVLVVNAPYVPTDEIAMLPAEARLHEATAALDGGPDGLDIQRRVIAAAPRWLAPTGHLLIETSERQAAHTLSAVTAAGLAGRVTTSSELDATVVVACLPREPLGR